MGIKHSYGSLLKAWLAAFFLLLWSGTAMAISVSCPSIAAVGGVFTCSLQTEPMLPSAFVMANSSYVWTSGSYNSYTGYFTAAGSQTLRTRFTGIEGVDDRYIDSSIYVIPASPIYSLGCPSSVTKGVPFTCSPSYYTGYTPSLSWSGADAISGNTLTFSTAGSRTVTYTANYGGIVRSLSQTITSIDPSYVTVNSLGCPASTIVGVPFTCSPSVSTNVGDVAYTWSAAGMTASGNTLTFASAGSKTITLTASSASSGKSSTGTQAVTAVAPVATITSLGCPDDVITGKAFTCSPQVSANVGSGVVYTWSGDGVTASGNNLTISGPGTKTVTYTATYPGVGTIGSGTQTVTVTTPSITVNSLGCPADATMLTPFNCTPSITTNLPASYASGVVYTWSGDGVTASGNTLTATTSGNKTITLNVNFPLADATVSGTQTVAVAAPTVSITSLGCPSDAIPGKPITCTPTVSVNIPESYQEGATYIWSADGMTASGNTLTFSNAGEKTVSLTVNYPLAPVSGTLTQALTVIEPAVTITTMGCPTDALLLKGFTCNPVVETNLPSRYRSDIQYSWTAEDIHVSGNSMAFSKAGTKTVALTATYPLAEVSGVSTLDINVVNPSLQITSVGCPNNVVALNDFTCTPVIETNVPASFKEGAIYTWSGNNLLASGNTLSYESSGTKTLTLKIEYPLATVTAVSSQTIAVSAPSATITSLGCPSYTVVGKPFTCTPTIVPKFSQSYQEGATYTWSGDGLTTNEDGTLTMSNAGGKTITLTVAYPLVSGVTASKTQMVVAISPYVTITSLGCPETELTTRTFTCSPKLSTNLTANLKEGATYTWSGDGLTINEDGSMSFATSGAKTIKVDAKFPLADIEASLVQNVDIVEPQAQVTSAGCPSEVVTGVPFQCNPQVTANFPSSFQTGKTYTWSGDNLRVDGSNLTFTTEGEKKITLTANYPLASVSGTMNQDMTVVTAAASITSLGCPTEVVTNEKFSCTPTITTNLPASYQNGAQYTWSGDGLQTNTDGTLLFTEKGSPKDITLQIRYPLANMTFSMTGQITVGALNLTINSLGCPEGITTQTPFTCEPSITYEIPESYRDKLTYSWTGNNLVSNSDGELAALASGSMDVTLTVAIKDTALTFNRTETINVSQGDVQITGLDCPESIIAAIPFMCTPIINPASQAVYQYSWSGSDLQVESGNSSLVYPTAGKNKALVLTAVNPETGAKLIYGTNINVSEAALNITSLGCPGSIRERKPFTCIPVIETNIPDEILNGLEYKWESTDISSQEDGSFVYSNSGSKNLKLSISSPTYTDVKATKSVGITVKTAAIKISYMGCPNTMIEYYPFTCTPGITTDSDTKEEEISYEWKIDEEVVSNTKNLDNAIVQKSGSTNITLTASIADPETDGSFISATSTITRDIRANSSPLKLRVTIPKRVNAGSQATLSASTSFSVPEQVVFIWTIDGATYEGSQIVLNIPEDRITPIEYSITASTPSVETISPETISGKIPVIAYSFPTIYFYGPKARATNIIPFSALFRLGVTNYNDTPLTYTWDFGDGTVLPATTELTRVMRHTYEKEGTYTATLTVTDDKGNVKQYTADVYTAIAPARQIAIRTYFSNKTNRVPLDVYCRYKITEGLSQDVPISNVWSIDGSPLSEKSIVTFNFTVPGTYTLGLDVITKYGNTLKTTVPIVVNENVPPVCSINTKMIKAGKYQFDAMCYDEDGRIVSYQWDFGDGTTGTSARAYREYSKSGSYTIKVTATDNSGGVVTAESTLDVP